MRLDLLHARDIRRKAEDERLRLDVERKLRAVLAETMPGSVVWVYGSLIQAGRFGLYSDIDLAIESYSGAESIEYLQSLLTAATGHRVDIGWLKDTRLADKIRQTGQRWIGPRASRPQEARTPKSKTDDALELSRPHARDDRWIV